MRRAVFRVGACLLAAVWAPRAGAAQSLGHKLPGTIGIDAGTQPPPGIYAANRFLVWTADRLLDRDGEPVPIAGFELDAIADAVGVAGTLRLDSGLHLSAAVAVPYVRLKLSSDDPRVAADRFGLGDAFFKPVQIGWKWALVDLVASYGLYAPTRQINREGLGSSQWSHQLSVGGTLSSSHRRVRISALFSYDRYQRKLDIDVTRGASVQVQGGLSVTVLEHLDVGLAGYALAQVADDRGAELPPALRGRRDRVLGLGPEVKAPIPGLRARLGARYTWDLDVRARPEGRLLIIELDVAVWSPRR